MEENQRLLSLNRRLEQRILSLQKIENLKEEILSELEMKLSTYTSRLEKSLESQERSLKKRITEAEANLRMRIPDLEPMEERMRNLEGKISGLENKLLMEVEDEKGKRLLPLSEAMDIAFTRFTKAVESEITNLEGSMREVMGTETRIWGEVRDLQEELRNGMRIVWIGLGILVVLFLVEFFLK
jgi:chromosome segregation ATPase